MSTHLIQYKVRHTALSLFIGKGYDNVRFVDIANEAGLTEQELSAFFKNKQDIILSLYQSICADWENQLQHLNSTKLHERFEEATFKKIALIAPYADLLRDIIPLLMRDSSLGVPAHRTNFIRSQGQRLMKNLVEGASDSNTLKKKVDNLPSLLYLVHWAALFIYLQNNNLEKTRETVNLFGRLIKRTGSTAFLLPFFPFLKDLTDWADSLLEDNPVQSNETDVQIARAVFNYRKVSTNDVACHNNRCAKCFLNHLPKIDYFIQKATPVHFIIPVFPDSRQDKLSELSDEFTLLGLNKLCREIAELYVPGARISICTLGKAGVELMGATDKQSEQHLTAINEIISEVGIKYVDILTLEDLLPDFSMQDASQELFAGFADSFLNSPDEQSWNRFLKYSFPEAIRLSLHEQPAHGQVIGLKMARSESLRSALA